MKVAIISGYFNPLHGGHLDMIEAAREIGDKVVAIVNNDKQQLIKKGKIINTEQDRVRVVEALRDVDEVVLSIDEEGPVIKTLEKVAKAHSGDQLIFGNGGDRNTGHAVPETAICKEYGIEMVFDMGGNDKADSSTRINRATGDETHAGN